MVGKAALCLLIFLEHNNKKMEKFTVEFPHIEKDVWMVDKLGQHFNLTIYLGSPEKLMVPKEENGSGHWILLPNIFIQVSMK